MSLQSEIQAAIGVHSLWKGRLKTAIDTGKSEFSPEKVATDNQCDFGKWLYTLPAGPSGKAMPHYETIRKQHAEFHKTASDVLRLALQGKKEEAKKLIAPGSRFALLSLELTRSMMDWQKSAH